MKDLIVGELGELDEKLRKEVNKKLRKILNVILENMVNLLILSFQVKRDFQIYQKIGN